MHTKSLVQETVVRRGIRYTGIVQGVGFRPFLANLARQWGITGFVYNDVQGVYVEIQGAEEAVTSYEKNVESHLPVLARLDSVEIDDKPIEHNEVGFSILPSPEGEEKSTLIAPDSAPCEKCLEELKNKENHRYEYSFINCTHCGPRYTIIEDIPYDRQHTTMKEFSLCSTCAKEYKDSTNRRYHAEPIACETCGPSYRLLDHRGNEVRVGIAARYRGDAVTDSLDVDSSMAAIKEAQAKIQQGHIVAIKGIGGYHLACDAHNAEAVARLRERKQRPAKPLAVMAGSLEALRKVAALTEAEETLLGSPARPIVLVSSRRPRTKSVYGQESKKSNWHLPTSIAATPFGDSPLAEDQLAWDELIGRSYMLGAMLPYAPIHYLLVPETDIWVMTSGNYSSEPVIYEDEEAITQLGVVADFILTHNRPIAAPVDDSVMAVVEEEPVFYRRSRGYVPLPITVKSPVRESVPNRAQTAAKKTQPCILAMGGDLKNTFAINRGNQVFISPHLGDLENLKVREQAEKTLLHYEKLFAVKPELVVVDKHPNYYSSAWGREICSKFHLSIMEVQHHYSHLASVMAEHKIEEPVIGVCFDGTGYGDDGTMWGGEFFLCGPGVPNGYHRAAHLAYAPLPGGEMAVKEPWRQALWYSQQLADDRTPAFLHQWQQTLPRDWRLLMQAMQSDMPMMMSSSAGRLFEAMGCLLQLGNQNNYEGQLAIELEQLATGERGRLKEFIYENDILDFSPLVHEIIEKYGKGVSRTSLAASFHRTVAYGITEVTEDLRRRYGVNKVILSGGVFQNRRLLKEIFSLWEDSSHVYLPRQLPANDGGLSLGQWWIADQMLR